MKAMAFRRQDVAASTHILFHHLFTIHLSFIHLLFLKYLQSIQIGVAIRLYRHPLAICETILGSLNVCVRTQLRLSCVSTTERQISIGSRA